MPTRPAMPHAETAPLGDIDARCAADLLAGADPGELLRQLLAPLMQLVGAQGAAVRVWSAAGDGWRVLSQIGLPEPVAGKLPHQDGDADGDPFGAPPPQVMAVPMTYRGRVLGQIELCYAVAPIADTATLALLKVTGELLGLVLHNALHNARLEDEALRAALLSQRQAMAAEVHDSVAQTLAFVKMRMPLLHEAITAQDAVIAVRYCDDVRQAVGAAHTNLRQLLSEFRVPMDPQGLKHALQSSILVFAQRTQVALDFDDQAPELHLSATQESQVFHIVQESLTNIAKHASARRAWLCIKQVVGRVDVVVEDDGTGAVADSVAPSSHFGIDIMRERAVRLGGHLDIGPRQGGGMRVHLSFPLISGPTVAA